ncbi:MAG: hypothetical protein EHM36_12885 [Deltaproteobacteria bacterium]|nr:MAG: hypothetical protein EHM36_12885 [Deltaproteobacteria bacterium]
MESEVKQMEACEIPRQDMLPPTVVHLEIKDPSCDFECVMKAAKVKAESYDNAPRLLSWFDKKGGSFSPGDCCVEGEPSWLAFAQAKGADLTIDVNNEDYIFVFRMSHGLP